MNAANTLKIQISALVRLLRAADLIPSAIFQRFFVKKWVVALKITEGKGDIL